MYRGRRGRDRMVVEFTTTYALSAYHHYCEFESRSNEAYSMHHYVIKFVSDLSPGTSLSSSNKTSLHDITEILLKMSLSITTPFYLFVIMICRLLIGFRYEKI